jgi:RNA polymerase sigma-70 factor (ECF subfamily)
VADATALHPASGLESAEARDDLDRALQCLPEEHRLVLLLRYSDGLSYVEIAAATGLPIGTVMSRLFNGKRKLRQVLEQRQDEDSEEREP